MAKEKFKPEEYFANLKLEDVRMKFKQTSRVLPTIRSHFKRKYKETSLKCPSCKDFRNETIPQEGSHLTSVDFHPLGSLTNQEDESKQENVDTIAEPQIHLYLLHRFGGRHYNQ